MAVAARELVAPASRGGKPSISVELVERAAPVSLAAEQRLPVLPALEPLLPGRGLRRGTVVAVEGSSSLVLALAAAASAEGSWCAAVGRPALGLVAAAELGVVLERLALVPAPDPSAGAGPGGWAWVVATLLDAVDLVLAWPPPGRSGRSGRSVVVRPADARRLAARARERGSVLVVAGQAWPEAPDVTLTVAGSAWVGPGAGDGRLRGRRVEVVGGGRRAASGERRVTLWLPAVGGGVVAVRAEDAVGLREVG